jgi:anti-anti-sigma factor
MYIKIRENEGYIVIDILSNEIDRKTLNIFRMTLRNLLKSNNSKIIINMHNVNKINNKFLGCLMAFKKKFDSIGTELSIFSVKPEVLSIFYIIRLDNYLNIYNTEYDILQKRSPLVKRRFSFV